MSPTFFNRTFKLALYFIFVENKNKMKFCTYIFFFLITLTGFGQKIDPNLKSIDNDILDLMKRYDAVGLSVAVVKDNQVIYSKGFGFRDLEQKLPVTENTVFHIASMSKAFTGGLLGILEGENELALKDKPALYISDFQFYNEKMDNLITIEDLLSHKSGLGGHGLSIVMFPEENKLKTVRRLKYLKPQDEVKNSWQYSNLGYTLAGTIVERTTGQTWDAYLQERIFTPLQMNASFTRVKAMQETDNFSLGYNTHQGKNELVPFENYYSYTPAGAIKSSAKDLTNWMHLWLNEGIFNNKQVVPKAYIQNASSLQNIKYGDHENYEKNSFLQGEGFGWRLRSWFGHYRLRHGGNTMGFSTVMELFPFDNIGIVVLTNQTSSLLPYAVSDHIARKLHGIPTDFEYPIDIEGAYKPDAKDQPFNKAKMPTQGLNEFMGTYDAEGYGKIIVTKKEGKLLANLPTYTFKLEHLNYNNFYLKGMPDFKEGFNPEFTVKFTDNHEGKINRLQIIGAQNEPVVFIKE